MKTDSPILKIVLVASALLLVLAACTPATTPPAPTDTPIPPTLSPTLPPPTATTVPLYPQVTLTSSGSAEAGQNPDYTITTSTPVLTGSDDPRVAAFNSAAQVIVQLGAGEFKTNLINMQPLPDLGESSTFEERYTLLSPPGSIFSLKFENEGYIEGMAHPYHTSRTLTFDLEAGKEATLDSLFLPGSKYLETISAYCVAQLKTRDIGFDMFAEGASPTPENYQVWNITADGLLITFNDYQVAPYAAGPQTVTVPYAELSALIDPQGPLAGIAP